MDLLFFFDRTNETNNWWGKGYDQEEEVERGSNVTHISFLSFSSLD